MREKGGFMKRFLRILGIVLMALNGITFVAILFNLFGVLADMDGKPLEKIAELLLIEAVYAAFFFVGWKLFQYGDRERAAQHVEAKRRAADIASEKAVYSNFANRAGSATISAPAASTAPAAPAVPAKKPESVKVKPRYSPPKPAPMKLAFRGFCRRSDAIEHVDFTDHSVESHFYPGGIPRIDRTEDGWTFLGGWDDMRGPTVRDRGLTRDEAMKRLAGAIEYELEYGGFANR